MRRGRIAAHADPHFSAVSLQISAGHESDVNGAGFPACGVGSAWFYRGNGIVKSQLPVSSADHFTNERTTVPRLLVSPADFRW